MTACFIVSSCCLMVAVPATRWLRLPVLRRLQSRARKAQPDPARRDRRHHRLLPDGCLAWMSDRGIPAAVCWLITALQVGLFPHCLPKRPAIVAHSPSPSTDEQQRRALHPDYPAPVCLPRASALHQRQPPSGACGKASCILNSFKDPSGRTLVGLARSCGSVGHLHRNSHVGQARDEDPEAIERGDAGIKNL
jgi:hypothetical protein